MNIAILGAGNVGSALGKAWQEAGHEIHFGLRNPKDPKHRVLEAPRTHLRGIREAVQAAETVVLAVPWAGVNQTLELAGPLKGKLLIDCTNPLKSDFSGLEIGLSTSAGEQVASWAAGARVVKAFNSTGARNMTPHARFPLKPVMFICGDEADAKAIVLKLAREAGFDARDAGELEVSRLLEPLALLWINLAIRQNYGFEFAFALMPRL